MGVQEDLTQQAWNVQTLRISKKAFLSSVLGLEDDLQTLRMFYLIGGVRLPEDRHP